MGKPDTGESTASINRRRDDQVWPAIFEALREGHTIVRPRRLDRFYIDQYGTLGSGGLSRSRVRKLEQEGVLCHVGVDRYALTDQSC
jgi:hypothetical protein